MDTKIEYLANLVNATSTFLVNYGFQILGAVIILVLGWQVASWAGKFTRKLCQRSHLDITLSLFFANIAKGVVLMFVIIIALGKFGITISPFIAAVGAIAFGSTLALQGPLSNFGSGLLIILSRPFVVGNTITIQGVTGIVDEIKLSYTRISDEDGRCITIPNNQIVGEILSNSFANMVVESVIRISYQDDPEAAIGILKEVMDDISEVSRQPAPLIGIAKFAESTIEIGLRYWVPTKKYYEIQYAVNREIYRRIRERGIQMQHPHLIKNA